MSISRPELIFVAGPQQGERAVLMTDRVVAGRSSACEINLKEEFASRHQFVFMLTSDGWTMENLSTNGTRVNGKKYKQGKKLLFATGDVIGVGVDTLILYVAPGEDSEKAIAEFRKSSNCSAGPESVHAADQDQTDKPEPADGSQAKFPADFDRQAQSVAAAKPVSLPPQKFQAQTISGRAMPQEPPEVAEVSTATAKSPKKRSRRLMIIGIVGVAWTVVLIVLGAILLSGKDVDTGQQPGVPVLLLRNDIAESLLASLPRPGKPDQAKADKALKDAQDLFPRRMANRHNRYNVVRGFKVYLALKAGAPVFPYEEQDHQYQTACNELVEDVVSVYDNAYSLERNKNWTRAQIEFSKLMDIVPERDKDDPAYSRFISNVLTHLTYIRQQSKPKK